jgi:hypothetical protein
MVKTGVVEAVETEEAKRVSKRVKMRTTMTAATRVIGVAAEMAKRIATMMETSTFLCIARRVHEAAQLTARRQMAPVRNVERPVVILNDVLCV